MRKLWFSSEVFPFVKKPHTSARDHEYNLIVKMQKKRSIKEILQLLKRMAPNISKAQGNIRAIDIV